MTVAETVPPHQVLTKPITANEESVTRLSASVEEDYFNRTTSHPKTPHSYHEPHVESAQYTPPGQEDHSHHIESASGKPQQSCLPVKADSGYDNHQGDPTQSDQYVTLPIRRKEVGSAFARRRASSSETVIHNTEIEQPLPVKLPDNPGSVITATPPSLTPRLEVTTPGETTHTLALISPTLREEPFLDILRGSSEYKGLQENEAIVTSYQSVSMSQALTHHRSLQNPKNTLRANRITSLEDFPPVALKDPISAGIPSKPQSQGTPLPWPVLQSIPRLLQQELCKLNSF
jgi:hypothetical protein